MVSGGFGGCNFVIWDVVISRYERKEVIVVSVRVGGYYLRRFCCG